MSFIGAIAMRRVQAVAEFLCRLDVEAFVAFKENRVVVELTMDEYYRCEKKLQTWFELLDVGPQSVRLIERQRGNFDERAAVSVSQSYWMS
jgi:hypothetical protein